MAIKLVHAFTSTLVCFAACGSDSEKAPDARVEQTIDAQSSRWQSLSELQEAQQETAVVAVGSKVYVLGGFDGSSNILDRVAVYDTVAKTWSEAAKLPVPAHHINAGVVDGKIVVVGMLLGLGFTANGAVWVYDPATNVWTTKTAMAAGTERGAAAVGVVGGKMFLAGGLRGRGVTQVTSYTLATDTHANEPAYPLATEHVCGGVINGEFIVAGGRNATIASIKSETYALSNGTWQQKAAMPTARGGAACAVANNKLVVLGGEGATGAKGVFAEVEAFDGTSWQKLEAMPVPRHGMGAAGIGNQVFVPGGGDQQGFGASTAHDVFTVE